MGDKFDGALAGGGRSDIAEVTIPDALQDLSLHETLIAADVEGALTLLRAVQNPYHGGIMVTAELGDVGSSAMTEAIRLSQMTSMLTDGDRCSKYAKAIANALEKYPDSRVLDIGTGTGLLAMLAARSGACHVDAVEMFRPMADLASRIIQDNQLHHEISLHAVKSTDLMARKKKGDPALENVIEKSDILVTEIFDSALLGEACVPVIRHAHDQLLNDDATVIPAKAALFGTVLCSELCSRFQDLGSHFPLHRSESSRHCLGGTKGIPLHIDALHEGKDYNFLTNKFAMFDFEFSSKGLNRCLERTQQKNVKRVRNGRPNAILTWWELDLTGSGDVGYSTEPGRENWQDHWLPVVYPLPSRGEAVTDDECIPLSMGHDEMSFWFGYGGNVKSPRACSCGFHALPGGPYRIFELGDKGRLESLRTRICAAIETVSALRSSATERVRCVDVSDSAVCGLIASQVETGMTVEVTAVEEDSELSAFLYEQVARRRLGEKSQDIHIEYNPLSAVIEREVVQKMEQADWQGFNVILSEPYTRAMHAYPLSTLSNLIVQRNALTEVLAPDFRMVPRTARVKARAICFPPGTLQRAFGGVQEVQGFDHGSFAKLYTDWPGSQRISLPLFQYSTTAVSETSVLISIDLCAENDTALTKGTETTIRLIAPSSPDAVALWVEYDGEPPSRVARSEVVWLGDRNRAAMTQSRRLVARCTFRLDTGSFEVSFSAQESP